MLDKILFVLFYACCLGGVIVWLYATYHWIQMFCNVQQGMKLLVFLTPIGLFLPSCFTEKGNHHRLRALVGMLMFLAFCLLGGLFWHLHIRIGI